jgi:hypothetical protein
VAAYETYVAILLACCLLQPAALRLGRRARLILTGMTVLAIVAALATLTITAVVGLLVSVVLLGRMSRRLGRSLGLLLGALALAAFVLGPLVQDRLAYLFAGTASPYATASIVPSTWPVRLAHWTEVFWPVIQPNLAFGVRPSLDPTLAWNSTENYYILLLYRGGLPLLLAFVAFATLVVREARHVAAKGGLLPAVLSRAVVVIISVHLILDIFDSHFAMAGEPELIAIVLGLMVAAARLPAQAGETAADHVAVRRG